MLQGDRSALQQLLLSARSVMPREVLRKPYTPAQVRCVCACPPCAVLFGRLLSLLQASNARDAVMKYLYSKLFDWIVSHINACIQHPQPDGAPFIGVLDIFGFELFKVNSFEQLCINYTNESLQQQFNQFVLKADQVSTTSCWAACACVVHKLLSRAPIFSCRSCTHRRESAGSLSSSQTTCSASS